MGSRATGVALAGSEYPDRLGPGCFQFLRGPAPPPPRQEIPIEGFGAYQEPMCPCPTPHRARTRHKAQEHVPCSSAWLSLRSPCISVSPSCPSQRDLPKCAGRCFRAPRLRITIRRPGTRSRPAGTRHASGRTKIRPDRTRYPLRFYRAGLSRVLSYPSLGTAIHDWAVPGRHNDGLTTRAGCPFVVGPGLTTSAHEPRARGVARAFATLAN